MFNVSFLKRSQVLGGGLTEAMHPGPGNLCLIWGHLLSSRELFGALGISGFPLIFTWPVRYLFYVVEFSHLDIYS